MYSENKPFIFIVITTFFNSNKNFKEQNHLFLKLLFDKE